MAYRGVTNDDIDSLKSIVDPERVSTGDSVMELHSKDESFHERCRPEVVLFPRYSHEISRILKYSI